MASNQVETISIMATSDSKNVDVSKPVPNSEITKADNQKSSTGFSFNSNSTPISALAPSTGFSVAPKVSLPPTTQPSSTLGGFLGNAGFQGFGSKPLNGNSQIGSVNLFGKPKGDEEGGDDGQGEGEEEVQQLEPVEILKNDNDTDEILYEVSTKLFRFDKSANEWKDIGKGTLRVTRDQTQASAKKRILIRNNLGKITLNTNIWKGMTIKQSGKNGIQFFVPDETATIQLYLIKVKPDDLEKTLSFLSQIEKSL